MGPTYPSVTLEFRSTANVKIQPPPKAVWLGALSMAVVIGVCYGLAVKDTRRLPAWLAADGIERSAWQAEELHGTIGPAVPQDSIRYGPPTEEIACSPCRQKGRNALPAVSSVIASALIGVTTPVAVDVESALYGSRCWGAGYQSIHAGWEPLARHTTHHPINGNVDIWTEIGYDLACIFYPATFNGCQYCVRVDLYDCVDGNFGPYVASSPWMPWDMDCTSMSSHLWTYIFEDYPPLAAGHYYEAVFVLSEPGFTTESCGDATVVDTKWADSYPF